MNGRGNQLAENDIIAHLKVEVLKSLRASLAKNLNPTSHMDFLRSRYILSEEDCDEIKHPPSRRQRASKFLDILDMKGAEAYDALCAALREEGTQIFLLRELHMDFERRFTKYKELIGIQTHHPNLQHIPPPHLQPKPPPPPLYSECYNSEGTTLAISPSSGLNYPFSSEAASVLMEASHRDGDLGSCKECVNVAGYLISLPLHKPEQEVNGPDLGQDVVPSPTPGSQPTTYTGSDWSVPPPSTFGPYPAHPIPFTTLPDTLTQPRGFLNKTDHLSLVSPPNRENVRNEQQFPREHDDKSVFSGKQPLLCPMAIVDQLEALGKCEHDLHREFNCAVSQQKDSSLSSTTQLETCSDTPSLSRLVDEFNVLSVRHATNLKQAVESSDSGEMPSQAVQIQTAYELLEEKCDVASTDLLKVGDSDSSTLSKRYGAESRASHINESRKLASTKSAASSVSFPETVVTCFVEQSEVAGEVESTCQLSPCGVHLSGTKRSEAVDGAYETKNSDNTVSGQTWNPEPNLGHNPQGKTKSVEYVGGTTPARKDSVLDKSGISDHSSLC